MERVKRFCKEHKTAISVVVVGGMLAAMYKFATANAVRGLDIVTMDVYDANWPETTAIEMLHRNGHTTYIEVIKEVLD